MKLRFLTPNNAWMFVYGDCPIRLNGEPLTFPTRKAAVQAAADRGLNVTPDGNVEAKEYGKVPRGKSY